MWTRWRSSPSRWPRPHIKQQHIQNSIQAKGKAITTQTRRCPVNTTVLRDLTSRRRRPMANISSLRSHHDRTCSTKGLRAHRWEPPTTDSPRIWLIMEQVHLFPSRPAHTSRHSLKALRNGKHGRWLRRQDNPSLILGRLQIQECQCRLCHLHKLRSRPICMLPPSV